MMLVTGAGSGLGRYLHENLGGHGLTRANAGETIERFKRSGADMIVHAAFNAAREVDRGSLKAYLRDNVLLTEDLVGIPHKKFIFISTVDVYPKDGRAHAEDEEIDVISAEGLYAVTKLMSEAIVRRRGQGHLIIRASALLGGYSRRNSIIKIVEDSEPELTLSGDSRLNYVLHSDLLKFIEFAAASGIKGIYNAASCGAITLKEAAALAGKKVKFGRHEYDCGDISNNRIAALFPAFQKTSADVVREFIKERE